MFITTASYWSADAFATGSRQTPEDAYRWAVAPEKEDETGTIEVGKSADFIVINQNLLEIPPEKIHETKVLRTVLKGHPVYEGK